MPLVAHNSLPAFEKLREQGYEVLATDQPASPDLRDLHIGILNIMPDAALAVTERQFLRLIASCSQTVRFFVHFFSVPCVPRSAAAQAYIAAHYASDKELRREQLDALIISGANVANPTLEMELFWNPLREAIDWARDAVHSILCSCLATHAILKQLHGIDRQRLPVKKWGVYRHHIRNRTHPLLRGVNTRFDVPHSRFNEITREQLEGAGLLVLAESDKAGVHLAVSTDPSPIVYCQGHPEYDYNSLLKEYKREVRRFLNGEIEERPPYPENYFSSQAADVVESYLRTAIRALSRGQPVPAFPEGDVEPHLDNTWGDTATAIFENWIGLVCRLAHTGPCFPLMTGADRKVALGMRGGAS